MATLTPSAKQQFFDANGNPLAGGKLYTYAAGTTTPLATYTSSSGATPNTNPIILDSRGEANVWLGTSTYKFKLTTSADVEVWTVDNVQADTAKVLSDLAASNGSALVGFLQSGAGATARTVQSKLQDTVNVKDFGAVGDGITDDYQAFVNAIASFSHALDTTYYSPGGTILVPPGKYYLSQTLNVERTIALVGAGAFDYSATQMIFPVNVDGIVIHRYNTGSSGKGGDGSIIRGIYIQQKAGAGSTGSGIWMRARAYLQDLSIDGFNLYGVRIEATSGGGGTAEGNANNWSMTNVRCINSGSHGVYVDGADSNAGVGTNVDGSSNGGFGIFDSSFLGNTWIGCHTSSNTGGAYKTDNANAASVFLGCYSEPGQPSSSFVAPTIAIGGLNGAGITGTKSTLFGNISLGGLTVGGMLGYAIDNNCYLNIGAGVTNEEFAVVSGTNVNPFRWKSRTGEVYWNWANLTDVFSFYDRNKYVTRDLSAIGTTVGFPNGFLAEGKKARLTLSAAPTSGTWVQGDIVYNSAPTAGGYIGWVCTTGGTPGTWKTFGVISA